MLVRTFIFLTLLAPAALAQAAAPGPSAPPVDGADAAGPAQVEAAEADSSTASDQAAAPGEPTLGSPEGSGAGSPPSETEDVFADVEAELRGQKPPSGKAPATSGTAPVSGQAAMNPELSLIGDFAAAWFSDDDQLQTGGHDPGQTGFNLQALELNARSYVDPYMRFDATLVFGHDGVEVEEAYATTIGLPAGLQVRFGQLLTRFGRINNSHPHSWDFVDQPFAFGRVFGGDGNRGVGVETSALLPLPWFAEVSVSLSQADGEETARSFYGAANPGVDTPLDLLTVTTLKQFFDLSDDWSLLWGLSGAFGPNANGPDHRTAVYGTDLYVKYRPITRASYLSLAWQTEGLHRRRQLADTVLWDFGGYSQLALRFARRWSTAVRYDYGSRTFDLDGNAISDPLDPEWTGNRHRVSASLTHSPSEFSRLRLQGSRDMPDWRDPIWAVFLAAEVVIGAHGAHPF